MDPRRLLILAATGLCLSSCAAWGDRMPGTPASALPIAAMAAEPETIDSPLRLDEAFPRSPTERPYLSEVSAAPSIAAEAALDPPPRAAAGPRRAPRAAEGTGPPAIAVANAQARARSEGDRFVGGVQVFAWEPGRVYEIWTAPLRVTTLTLGPGETLVSKAAGDTVRWQIGETTSGEGPSRRVHVMIKPFERGLETNLVVTTSRRVYLLQLRSGSPDSFNTAVAWDLASVFALEADTPADGGARETPVASPSLQGPLDARYRIEPRGRRPRWTPTAVVTDGVRTFLHFPPDLQVEEAPVLFVLGSDDQPQTVNYRQQGGLWIVDRLFDRAELRLGDRRPQIVRITRLQP
jgi:type IV secretion system protein TrbG